MSVPKQPCVRHNSLPSEEPCGWWRLCPDRLKNQAGVDSAWQQENLEARVSTPPVDNQKLLNAKRGDESHLRSAAEGVPLCYWNEVALRHGRHYPWGDGMSGTCLGQERQGQSVAALGYPRKDQHQPVMLFDCPAWRRGVMGLPSRKGRTRIGRCNF